MDTRILKSAGILAVCVGGHPLFAADVSATRPVTGTEERGSGAIAPVPLPPPVPANSQEGIAARNTEAAANHAIPNAALQVQLAPQNQPPINPSLEGYAGPSTGVPVYTSQMPGQNVVNNPMLGSQVSHEIIQSGNLPSQIRFGEIQAGPLAPGGIVPYLQPLGTSYYAPGPATGAPTGPAAANMKMPLAAPPITTGAPVSPNAVDTRYRPTATEQPLEPAPPPATRPAEGSLGNKP